MKTIKSIIAALILTVGTTVVANAQTAFHVSVNTPGLHVSAGNYHPVRRVVYEQPVYAPVYHPVVYRPVVYHRPYYRPVYRPVVYRGYNRHVVYNRPAYHRGHGRW
jgi:hypothetical protein